MTVAENKSWKSMIEGPIAVRNMPIAKSVSSWADIRNDNMTIDWRRLRKNLELVAWGNVCCCRCCCFRIRSWDQMNRSAHQRTQGRWIFQFPRCSLIELFQLLEPVCVGNEYGDTWKMNSTWEAPDGSVARDFWIWLEWLRCAHRKVEQLSIIYMRLEKCVKVINSYNHTLLHD